MRVCVCVCGDRERKREREREREREGMGQIDRRIFHFENIETDSANN